MTKPRRRANVPAGPPSDEELLRELRAQVALCEKLWDGNEALTKANKVQKKTIDQLRETIDQLRSKLREAKREHTNGNGKARSPEHPIDDLDRELPLFALGRGTPGARGT